MTGSNPLRIIVTERDRQLLSLLWGAKLLDREQIQQLLDFVPSREPTTASPGCTLPDFSIGTSLARLPEVERLYAVSPRGAAMVGQQLRWKLRHSQDELLIGEPSVQHQLAVNWCWISMQRGPESKLIRFMRFNEPISAAHPLMPDGYAELSVPGGIQPIFLEVDLTTETSRVWNRKVELYLRLAATGEFQNIFQQQRFKVAVVCTTRRRLDGLRRVVRKQTPKLFYFTLLDTINRDGLYASPWLRPEGDAYQPIA